jgi:hypothetical protein
MVPHAVLCVGYILEIGLVGASLPLSLVDNPGKTFSNDREAVFPQITS